MTRCTLCYPFTHNEAQFLVVFGNEEQQLHVCKWCLEDLKLLGFNANQIVLLPKPPRFEVSFWVLGPVRNLLEVSLWVET